MKKWSSSKQAEAGISLVEILISLAALGVGAVVFSQYTQKTMASRKSAELLRHRTLITSMLVKSTDCRKTLGCVDGELRELRDSEGRVLVDAQGTSTYGPWQVRAQCQADKTIKVSVSSSVNGRFRKDPLNGKLLDHNNKELVLLQAGMLCGTLDKTPVTKQIITLNSARCTSGKGTCAPPEKFVKAVGGSTTVRMCCEDGRDVPKPVCPAGTQELSSHWDRDNDWGMQGMWVVLCN